VELEEYFDARRREFTLPLVYPGSSFQTKVWNALRDIPYGDTIPYEELARRVGSPTGQRAAGHANGQNPLAIIIPCHRVINKDGKLGGYGGGLWRKRLLLDLERTLEPDLFSRPEKGRRAFV
jgi:AraC family transcriptional regulator of adaptative response/methylated-DNA-[protein]-cysteine methyltransferase